MPNLINTPRFENGTITHVHEVYDNLSNKNQFSIDTAINAISDNRLIDNRVDEINMILEKQEINHYFEELPMGSGGVGQLRLTKTEVRFQIGYGHSKHNYAKCLVLPI